MIEKEVNKLFEVPYKNVYDFTIPNFKEVFPNKKVSLLTKFILLFVKKQISDDFIYECSNGDLWGKSYYKVLKGNYYILKHTTYLVVRSSHFKKMREMEVINNE